VRSFLLFGSTGDGWELGGEERRLLFDAYAALSARLGFRYLVGVLRPDAEATRAGIDEVSRRACELSGSSDAARALEACGIVGFTACAPRGAELSQEALRAGLASVLSLGYPTALYQLPQVTGNELSPESFEELAAAWPNFLLWKDSSGTDAVARGARRREGVFMLRGMEGDYARWYGGEGTRAGEAARGTDAGLAAGAMAATGSAATSPRYDGFLLASANSFAGEHAAFLAAAEAGKAEEAERISGRVSRILGEGLRLARELPYGNAFANAMKAFDHWLAFGPDALGAEPPLTHAGARLPPGLLAAAGGLLEREGLLPARGYLRGGT
jgi:dihydrodipicolinate synthase/N-acetylneuraminate lyase